MDTHWPAVQGEHDGEWVAVPAIDGARHPGPVPDGCPACDRSVLPPGSFLAQQAELAKAVTAFGRALGDAFTEQMRRLGLIR